MYLPATKFIPQKCVCNTIQKQDNSNNLVMKEYINFKILAMQNRRMTRKKVWEGQA
jgi:hypothetical protein